MLLPRAGDPQATFARDDQRAFVVGRSDHTVSIRMRRPSTSTLTPVARPRSRRRLLLIGCSLASFAFATTAASAAAAVRIGSVDPTGAPRIRLTIVTSRPTSEPPRVTEEGQLVADLSALNLGHAKSVVLAIDRSRSMHGKSLANAVSAALRFLALKTFADQFAVVSFASSTNLDTGFASDMAPHQMPSDRSRPTGATEQHCSTQSFSRQEH